MGARTAWDDSESHATTACPRRRPVSHCEGARYLDPPAMTRFFRADAGGSFCIRPRKSYKDESHRVSLERATHARQGPFLHATSESSSNVVDANRDRARAPKAEMAAQGGAAVTSARRSVRTWLMNATRTWRAWWPIRSGRRPSASLVIFRFDLKPQRPPPKTKVVVVDSRLLHITDKLT